MAHGSLTNPRTRVTSRYAAKPCAPACEPLATPQAKGEHKPPEKCYEMTPNPKGNRRGTCSCVLPKGHEGDHQCQASIPHYWPAECGHTRIGSLSGRMGPCELPAGHDGMHQRRHVRADGSRGCMTKWVNADDPASVAHG